MKTTTLLFFTLTAIALNAGPALAQHEAHDQHHEKAPAASTAPARVGDPYPLDTCPISGKKLGAMGDPVVQLYDGREVRFCCSGCPAKFEKDLAASWAKLDEKIVKDQGPLYPLKTSIVTGAALSDHPYDFVYGNRLVRLGAESEKAEFLKEPRKYLAALDHAVIEAQGKQYPLAKCVVSDEKIGGDMGPAQEIVVAGRLIRLCCKDCKEELDKNPAKFVAMVDAARQGKQDKPAHDPKGGNDKKPHNHK